MQRAIMNIQQVAGGESERRTVCGLVWMLCSVLAAATGVASSSSLPTSIKVDEGFTAVWNCPYMGKVLAATGSEYGISANPEASFNGSQITLFYGPHTWPLLKATTSPDVIPCWRKVPGQPCTWNQSEIWTNITVVQNGGVPQAADIEVHKAAVAEMVETMIPDPNFAGYGIFDWEKWRALYSENDDGLSYSNHYSMLLVQQAHPDWTNDTQIAAEAERQYNAGSRLFFTETLKVAQKLRPQAKFGFYEYPMQPSPELLWLWQSVGVLAGSDCA